MSWDALCLRNTRDGHEDIDAGYVLFGTCSGDCGDVFELETKNLLCIISDSRNVGEKWTCRHWMRRASACIGCSEI
jgi:hypothetical protein